MPKGKSRKELIKRYDDNIGFPTPEMVKQMKESVDRISKMKTFDDWFKVLNNPFMHSGLLYLNFLDTFISTGGVAG